ncbi:Sensor histidine kinase DesK [compost metagenome]
MMSGKKFELFPRRLGFFPYIWLIYIILPIINLRNESGFKLIAGYMMIALFVVTYRQLYFVSKHKYNLWLAVQMLLLLLLSTFINPYNIYMGFFTANFIGWYMDRRRFNKAMTAFIVVLGTSIILNLDSYPLQEILFVLPFFLMMLAAPFAIRSMYRKQMLESELQQAKEQINELVKREERMRIARDLHDTLGHTLSLITLKSQLVEKLVQKDPLRALTEAQEIQRTSRAALRQVRELVSEMRAITVVEELAEVSEILQTANITLQVEGDTSLEGISVLTQNILSLCIKEAVTNIVKHSNADCCHIIISRTDAEVSLTIEDNGGFTASEPISDTQLGNGLKGMSERLSLIEGSLHLSSIENHGARLHVVVPLIVKDRKDGEPA